VKVLPLVDFGLRNRTVFKHRMSDGQFDWGDRFPKSNESAFKVASSLQVIELSVRTYGNLTVRPN